MIHPRLVGLTDEAWAGVLVGTRLKPPHLPQTWVGNAQVAVAPLLLSISSRKCINNSTVIYNHEDYNVGKEDSSFKRLVRRVHRESVKLTWTLIHSSNIFSNPLSLLRSAHRQARLRLRSTAVFIMIVAWLTSVELFLNYSTLNWRAELDSCVSLWSARCSQGGCCAEGILLSVILFNFVFNV